MRIVLNGELFQCAGSPTLADLVRLRGFEPAPVAAVVNGSVARRDDFGSTVLRDGDKVNIVPFVGGG